MTFNFGPCLFQAQNVISPWAPGYNVVGENLKRNTRTNKVEERSVSTASASNLGDISARNIDGVIRRGKKARSVVRTRDYENQDPGKIEPRVTHRNANRTKKVDIEDVREISSMNAQGTVLPLIALLLTPSEKKMVYHSIRFSKFFSEMNFWVEFMKSFGYQKSVSNLNYFF